MGRNGYRYIQMRHREYACVLVFGLFFCDSSAVVFRGAHTVRSVYRSWQGRRTIKSSSNSELFCVFVLASRTTLFNEIPVN